MSFDGSRRCPSCGLEHGRVVEPVVVGAGAREALGREVGRRGWRRLLLVSDANTHDALGGALGADLAAAGHEIVEQRFAARHGLLADRDGIDAVRAALAGSAPDGVLAVGSGVVNDLTRYATYLDGIGYLAVPTAPSMDGYASSVAALQFDGVKVTLAAHAPAGIFADPAVLRAAPAEMIVWGLGDLLGKATARFDWLLGSAIAGEPYCELVADRVRLPLERCLADVESLVAGDEDAVVALTTGLVESGSAMAMMGNSRPASGCEHHASHFWDLLAYQGRRAHAPHGLQVGYATRWATAAQLAALERLGDPLLTAAGRADGEEETRWFGAQLAALEPVREEKRAWFAEHGGGWPRDSEAVEHLRDLLEAAAASFPAVGAALDVAGIPDAPGFLEVDDETLRATLRFANRLRARFTALDLLESQHRLAEVADGIVRGERRPVLD